MAEFVNNGPYETCEPICHPLLCSPVREGCPNDPQEVPPEEIPAENYMPAW